MAVVDVAAVTVVVAAASLPEVVAVASAEDAVVVTAVDEEVAVAVVAVLHEDEVLLAAAVEALEERAEEPR